MGSAVFPGSPSAPGPGQELRPETMHHTHHTSLISGPVGTGLEPQTRKARVHGLFEAAEGTRSLDLLLANGLADPRDVDRVMSTFRLQMSDISGPGDASKRRLDARRSGTFGAVFPATNPGTVSSGPRDPRESGPSPPLTVGEPRIEAPGSRPGNTRSDRILEDAVPIQVSRTRAVSLCSDPEGRIAARSVCRSHDNADQSRESVSGCSAGPAADCASSHSAPRLSSSPARG